MSWEISRTSLWNGSLRMSKSVDFWNLRISRCTTVPGLKRWAFFMVLVGVNGRFGIFEAPLKAFPPPDLPPAAPAVFDAPPVFDGAVPLAGALLLPTSNVFPGIDFVFCSFLPAPRARIVPDGLERSLNVMDRTINSSAIPPVVRKAP
eukprot:CAMPEP_0167825622 /NCGR_PEP_ID=MMETSP0112_2-20121227/9483_1 /TAXON_ID=91324 /ORGANISM="Lotharella globosa, Strain CCCM811" /LENGTH=147 /DNA_ID=CAMNT_0007727779 /DNA_START=492 /DNA_END=932 /DNA_ORIENTATION=-